MRNVHALFLALAAGCAPVRFTAQELHLRHDPRADALEITLVYEGLTARAPALGVARRGAPPSPLGNDDPLGESRRWVGRLAAGERVLILVDWPLVFDFERAQVAEEDAPWGASFDRRLAALADSIEPVDVRLFVDERGRLGALQRLRWNDLSAGLDTVNELLHLWAEHDLPPEDEWEGSPRTRALLLAHSRARRPWVTLEHGELEVRVPLAAEDFAATLRDLVGPDANEDSRAVARGILGATEVALDDEGLRLRYAAATDGGIHLRFERPALKYDGRLAAALTLDGVELPVIPLVDARAWAARR